MALSIVQKCPNILEASAVTANGFSREVTKKLTQDVKNHLEGDLVFSILDKEGILKGFAIFQVWNKNILYLHGIQLLEDIRGQGIAKECILLAKGKTGANFIALRTQSPIMWASVQKLCNNWTPSPRKETDDEIRDVIRIVEAKTSTTFPVHRSRYGDGLYGKKPVHSDSLIQGWWDDLCKMERGDAVLCIGSLN